MNLKSVVMGNTGNISCLEHIIPQYVLPLYVGGIWAHMQKFTAKNLS